jgi:hypothetical protein
MKLLAMQWQDNRNVDLCGAGSAIGINEVIFQTERRTTVLAEDTVEAFYLPGKVFRAIMRSNELVCLASAALQHAAALSTCEHICKEWFVHVYVIQPSELFKVPYLVTCASSCAPRR